MKMKFAAMLFMMSLFAAAFVAAQAGPAGALLTDSRAKKTAGDLQGAMLGLERIILEFSADRNAAANALLEMGAITEQLGQTNRARTFYERVRNDYKDQAAEVRTAEARLAGRSDSPASAGTRTAGELSRITLRTPYTDDPYSFALSPDGQTLVIQVTTSDGKKQLWRMPVDSSKKAEPIPGTEGAGVSSFPFFSPDGRSIGYFANQKLWRIDLAGGKPTELASAPNPGGGSWGKNDVIVFGGLPFGQPLQKVENGRVSALTPSQFWYVTPTFMEEDRFLYYVRDGRGRGNLEIGSVREGIAGAGTRGGIPTAQAGSFTSGYLVYMTEERLVAQKFDPQALMLSGSNIPLAERVGREPPLPGKATFAVSLGGAIAYRETPSAARQMKWIDRAGKPVGNLGPIDSASPQSPRISPDGRNVLFTRMTVPRGNAIWVIDVLDGTPRLLRETSMRAAWSPDGKRILFSASGPRGQSPTLLDQQIPSGPGRFPLPNVLAFPSDIGSNGALLYTTALGAGDVFALPANSEMPVPVANSTAAERGGRFSPNGAWIAYQSDESGRNEIYVQPFPGTSAQRQRVSFNGGINPEWDPKRQAIYFLSPDYHLMTAVAEATADNKSIEFSTPRPLFEKPLMTGSEYAPAPDGERFFVIEPIEDAPQITVLSNWAR